MKDREIGVLEAKILLAELIERVAAGERFYIMRRGERVAELRPATAEKLPFERGCAARAAYRMAPDFGDELEDFLE